MRMMRDFVRRTPCPELYPAGDALTEAVGRIMALPGLEVLLAVHDGEVIGGTGVLYTPFLWNPEILVGEGLFLWAARDAPFRTGHALFTESLRRCEQKQAIPFIHVMSTTGRGMARLCERHGCELVETIHMRKP